MSASAAGSSLVPATTAVRRRRPIGAEYVGEGRTHFRVWAPASNAVSVVSGDLAAALAAEGDGYFSGEANLSPGARYQFQLTSGDRPYPDPASRFQPDGPHGASEIVDATRFPWTDAAWRGARIEGQVVYELHVGTFTPEGTWAAATRELAELARLGITMIEVMPIAEFDGRFGWGYDGVDLFAPMHTYGTPDDARRFVDAAHAVGIAVILDVVYNHFGPSGNYLRAFSPAYFTDKHDNEWGDAINFDGADAAPVREFFLANAAVWIDEFHFDGLRLDATQQIFDDSAEHILLAIGRAAREAAGGRSIVLVAENERQDARLVRPVEEGGYGLDGLWNDDFHHSAMVAATGRREAYYSDTRGDPQEFVSAAKYGYLFQGQFYAWQRQPRGTPTWGVSPARFVVYLQNHDQIANSAAGIRGHQMTSPSRWRALTALLLLSPGTPMLFQGQEFASSAPFLYFADFDEALAAAIRKGRAEFLTQFPSIVDFEARSTLDDPASESTFDRCKLDFAERERHGDAYSLHHDLLSLRRTDATFARSSQRGVDGAVLSCQAFALRFFGETHVDDRVLVVNLGADVKRSSFAEPLLAPPPGREWTVMWSSESPQYGGRGMAAMWPKGWWRIPAESAVVLGAGRERRPTKSTVRRRTA
jgi:maltooligosyltrehalose trehalohydrolase